MLEHPNVFEIWPFLFIISELVANVDFDCDVTLFKKPKLVWQISNKVDKFNEPPMVTLLAPISIIQQQQACCIYTKVLKLSIVDIWGQIILCCMGLSCTPQNV